MPLAKDLHTIAGAAREMGLSTEHLWMAVKRGHVKRYDTADGHPLVRLEHVRAYLETPPKRGRPPKRKK